MAKVRGSSYKKTWRTFNKAGIGGIDIIAKTKKEALKVSREHWGRGATVDFLGKKKYTTISL